MFPESPKSLDSFWPRRGQPSLPYAPYRTPHRVTAWITPGELARYEADCAAGRPNRYGPRDIEYRYNAQGFRCLEFADIPVDSFVVASVGCSNTEGIGLPVEHTWPSLLCGKLATPLGKVSNVNLGLGASSNQHIAIRACRAMESPDVDPDMVVLSWSYPHRLLYFYEDGELMDWPFPIDAELKPSLRSLDPKVRTKRTYFEQIQSRTFDLGNLMANIMLVEATARHCGVRLCHSFLLLDVEDQDWLKERVDGLYGWREGPRNARDLMHFGWEYNEWVAILMADWCARAGLSRKGEVSA